MKRLGPSLAVIAVAALGGVGGAAGAPPVFVVVPSTTQTQAMAPLATAEVPNAPGLLIPAAPADPHNSPGLPFSVLQGIWQRAGSEYGIPWQVLAAINKVESNFGRNMGPSSAGAIGWMQFMPDTWLRWGMDANGDGVSDPWNAEDAIFAAARYLAASGGRTDISRAIFSYNHAQWYVDEVLGLARLYGNGGVGVAFSLDRLQVRLSAAQDAVAKQNRVVIRGTTLEKGLARRTDALYARADRVRLLSDRLALEKRAFQTDALRVGAARLISGAKQKLKSAEQALADARASSVTSTFTPGAGTLLSAPSYQGGYVFPVGGGPSIVSVGHTHHDYPAADIAAPEGSPLYALTNAVIVRAWHMPSGNCGIGLTLHSTLDGREWTYCHMSFEEPSIQAGVQVNAGAPVGLVGSTGDATGPHLHLQIDPPLSYPQVEPWFQSFAGTAFRWQDAPTPMPQGGPVFEVVSPPPPPVPVSAPVDGSVIAFTLNR